jgi:tetratricopeptide (TPR) repeat protein
MNWKKFPYPDQAYAYPGDALQKNWPRLHRGDAEPFPDASRVQEAWRAYHAGDFARAVELGIASAPAGWVVANKATVIYANYLESDEKRKLELLLEAAARCEQQQADSPACANAWYLHAYALGRYSQGISVAKALAQGIGGKIRRSLERAIELEPAHADAHIALGAYHAEVIDKVGALVGGLTYGARKDAGVDHFTIALRLNPDSAIARVEYANGLAMMFGRSRLRDAERLYAEAAAFVPQDAMERLDVELARAEIADD